MGNGSFLFTPTAENNCISLPERNTWFVSDSGSDDNDCHTEDEPCKNLQTVLNRAEDGADIYVTSDTLSLDLVQTTMKEIPHENIFADNDRRNCCMLTSNISFNMKSSVQQNSCLLTCSQSKLQQLTCVLLQERSKSKEQLFGSLDFSVSESIWWNLWESRSITGKSTHVSLHDLRTDTHLMMNISADVVMENFTAGELVFVTIQKSQLDDLWTTENVNLIVEEDWNKKESLANLGHVSFRNCHLKFWTFVDLLNANKKLDFYHCELNSMIIACANTRNRGEAFAIAGVQIIESSIDWGVGLESAQGYILFVAVEKTIFHLTGLKLYAPLYKCKVHKCVFLVHTSALTLIARKPNTMVSVVNCSFSFINSQQMLPRDRIMIKVGYPDFGSSMPGQQIFVKNVTFQLDLYDAVYGNILSFPMACNISLTDVNFILTQLSPAKTLKCLLYVGALSEISFDSVSIDFTEAMFSLELLALAQPSSLVMKNLNFFCATGYFVFEHSSIKSKQTPGLFYRSKKYCKEGQYTFEAGFFKLNGLYNKLNKTHSNFQAATQHPHCLSCPVGAQCEGDVKALPNYWGYKNSLGVVSMIRCQKDYCCSHKETCDSINSCHMGRTGTLCGKCEENKVESLMTVQCVQSENCSLSLVIALYCCLSLAIAVTLTIGETMKNLALKICSNLCAKLKRKEHNTNGNTNAAETSIEMRDTEEPPVSNQDSHQEELKQESACSQNTTGSRTEDVQPADAKNEESGMKYIQILLYYVQDGSLFETEVPLQGTTGTSALQLLLQFSPDIVGFVYKNITSICIPSSTSITKVVFQAALGPCVLSSVFLMYLIQRYVSKFMRQILWTSIRCSLMKAFVMTLLFSYQKIVTGIFTLVQCVEVDQSNVLYVYGELQCYTWWQHVLHIYIFMAVISFFVFGCFSLAIQDPRWNCFSQILCLKLYISRSNDSASLYQAIPSS